MTLYTLIERARFVGGIDRSHVMVERARARFPGVVATGRADFRVGTVEELPFEPASFDKICTVNTIYFWRSVEAGFAEIRRVLTPGGRAVVGFLPNIQMDRNGDAARYLHRPSPEDIVAALEDQEFFELSVERPQPTTPWNVVVARR